MTEAMPFPKTDIVLSYESAPETRRFFFSSIAHGAIACYTCENGSAAPVILTNAAHAVDIKAERMI